MNTGQIQVRLSLTDQLYQFLLGQSSRLGIPVTQVIKHMVIEKAQQDNFPVFQASVQTETAYHEAMADERNAIEINDIDSFFKSL